MRARPGSTAKEVVLFPRVNRGEVTKKEADQLLDYARALMTLHEQLAHAVQAVYAWHPSRRSPYPTDPTAHDRTQRTMS